MYVNIYAYMYTWLYIPWAVWRPEAPSIREQVDAEKSFEAPIDQELRRDRYWNLDVSRSQIPYIDMYTPIPT